MEKEYKILRRIVHEDFRIVIKDKPPEVFLVPCEAWRSFPWIQFGGETIEKALKAAIEKLRYPDFDYVDEDGQAWPANGNSIYCKEHVMEFLREKDDVL